MDLFWKGEGDHHGNEISASREAGPQDTGGQSLFESLESWFRCQCCCNNLKDDPSTTEKFASGHYQSSLHADMDREQFSSLQRKYVSQLGMDRDEFLKMQRMHALERWGQPEELVRFNDTEVTSTQRQYPVASSQSSASPVGTNLSAEYVTHGAGSVHNSIGVAPGRKAWDISGPNSGGVLNQEPRSSSHIPERAYVEGLANGTGELNKGWPFPLQPHAGSLHPVAHVAHGQAGRFHPAEHNVGIAAPVSVPTPPPRRSLNLDQSSASGWESDWLVLLPDSGKQFLQPLNSSRPVAEQHSSRQVIFSSSSRTTPQPNPSSRSRSIMAQTHSDGGQPQHPGGGRQELEKHRGGLSLVSQPSRQIHAELQELERRRASLSQGSRTDGREHVHYSEAGQELQRRRESLSQVSQPSVGRQLQYSDAGRQKLRRRRASLTEPQISEPNDGRQSDQEENWLQQAKQGLRPVNSPRDTTRTRHLESNAKPNQAAGVVTAQTQNAETYNPPPTQTAHHPRPPTLNMDLYSNSAGQYQDPDNNETNGEVEGEREGLPMAAKGCRLSLPGFVYKLAESPSTPRHIESSAGYYGSPSPIAPSPDASAHLGKSVRRMSLIHQFKSNAEEKQQNPHLDHVKTMRQNQIQSLQQMQNHDHAPGNEEKLNRHNSVGHATTGPGVNKKAGDGASAAMKKVLTF